MRVRVSLRLPFCSYRLVATPTDSQSEDQGSLPFWSANHASMAKRADALDRESSVERRASSILARGTNFLPAWRNAYALRLERSAFGIASSSLAAGTNLKCVL